MGKTTNPPKRMLPAQLAAWCYKQVGIDIGEDVAGFAEAMKAGAQTPATERYQIRYVPFEPAGSKCFNVHGAVLVEVMAVEEYGVEILVRLR